MMFAAVMALKAYSIPHNLSAVYIKESWSATLKLVVEEDHSEKALGCIEGIQNVKLCVPTWYNLP
jgi:hypothetical protein